MASPIRSGVINLPSFYMDMEGARHGVPDYKSTTRDVADLSTSSTPSGVDAVVMDLRNNGGGSLTEAINLTGCSSTTAPWSRSRTPTAGCSTTTTDGASSGTARWS